MGALSHTVTHIDGHTCNTHTTHKCADKNTSPPITHTQRCIHTNEQTLRTQMYPPPTKRVITFTCIDMYAQLKTTHSERRAHSPHQSPVSAPFGRGPCVELGMKRRTAWLQRARSGTGSEAGTLGCIAHHSSLGGGAKGTEPQVLRPAIVGKSF